MNYLIGTYECKIDVKGRLLIPSAFKKQLAPVVTKGFVLKRAVFQNCLELYPLNQWEELITKVNSLNRFKKKYEKINYKIADFFSYKNFKKLNLKNKADVITAFAVFYDIENPNKFLSDIKKCLDSKGIFIIEQSNLAHMIRLNSFDTICQEHLGYYSTSVVNKLLKKNKYNYS